MPEITLINLRHRPYVDFKCDRSTPLGNPFIMHSESERDQVCDKYHDWFYTNLNPDLSPVNFLDYLDEILQQVRKRSVTLGCWCVPKRCHCETIKEWLENELIR